jgi:hypothetical protein
MVKDSIVCPATNTKDQDVLCGRGKTAYLNPGNEALRMIVAANLEKYSISSRAEKTDLIRTLADELYNSGSRFMKKSKDTGLWHDIGLHAAKEKIAHAFRDAVGGRVKCMNDLGNNLPRRSTHLDQLSFMAALKLALQQQQSQPREDHETPGPSGILSRKEKPLERRHQAKEKGSQVKNEVDLRHEALSSNFFQTFGLEDIFSADIDEQPQENFINEALAELQDGIECPSVLNTTFSDNCQNTSWLHSEDRLVFENTPISELCHSKDLDETSMCDAIMYMFDY